MANDPISEKTGAIEQRLIEIQVAGVPSVIARPIKTKIYRRSVLFLVPRRTTGMPTLTLEDMRTVDAQILKEFIELGRRKNDEFTFEPGESARQRLHALATTYGPLLGAKPSEFDYLNIGQRRQHRVLGEYVVIREPVELWIRLAVSFGMISHEFDALEHPRTRQREWWYLSGGGATGPTDRHDWSTVSAWFYSAQRRRPVQSKEAVSRKRNPFLGTWNYAWPNSGDEPHESDEKYKHLSTRVSRRRAARRDQVQFERYLREELYAPNVVLERTQDFANFLLSKASWTWQVETTENGLELRTKAANFYSILAHSLVTTVVAGGFRLCSGCDQIKPLIDPNIERNSQRKPQNGRAFYCLHCRRLKMPAEHADARRRGNRVLPRA